uniref:Uncharacterized protein n=1 Tax=Anguilla anguilla TaxID=7936 RepID=A0A0E9SM74_ANGAN
MQLDRLVHLISSVHHGMQVHVFVVIHANHAPHLPTKIIIMPTSLT